MIWYIIYGVYITQFIFTLSCKVNIGQLLEFARPSRCAIAFWPREAAFVEAVVRNMQGIASEIFVKKKKT